MRKKRKRVIQISYKREAEYYLGSIESEAKEIQLVLEKLFDLAAYNAEMEEPLVRADKADDYKKWIVFKLEEIGILAEMITDFVR